MKARQIDSVVLAILSRSTTEGNALTLPPEQLPRDLYVKTNKVLEALGGKWNRKATAHLFDGDAGELVDAVILSGEVRLPDDFGFFPTPVHIVDQLIEAVGAQSGHSALEPSAGNGRIASRLKEMGVQVDCVELLPENIKKLADLGIEAIEGDFLQVPVRPVYDCIVMNPPFARRADIHHVMHASKFLKPGGRLASIMSAGVTFRDDKIGTGFRDFVEDFNGTIEPLPDDSFKDSGTGVRTVIVSLGAPE